MSKNTQISPEFRPIISPLIVDKIVYVNDNKIHYVSPRGSLSKAAGEALAHMQLSQNLAINRDGKLIKK